MNLSDDWGYVWWIEYMPTATWELNKHLNPPINWPSQPFLSFEIAVRWLRDQKEVRPDWYEMHTFRFLNVVENISIPAELIV